MNINKDDLAGKIRALLAKTVDNGCTEEEALTAARKAGELLDKYNLSMTEIELRAEPMSEASRCYGARNLHEAARFTVMAVAAYTNTRCWATGGTIHLFGQEKDVAVAGWLLDLFRTSMEAEFRRYRPPLHVNRRTLRTGFMRGMGNRLAKRLREMIPQTPTGKGLVVVKNALVEEAFAAKQLNLGKRGGSLQPVVKHAYDAGREAADRVNITTGITARHAGLLK